MILTAALALTLTVMITAYAASRGRSPLAWGGASVLITVASTLLAWASIQLMGTTDLVFARRDGALAMLAALAGPVLALLGNGVLASRLVALSIADNRLFRLILADGDPHDRDARVAEVEAIKRAIEQAARARANA